jgi:hypothetical protein
MVPFMLRIIKSELPFFLKTVTGIPGLDPLYELLNVCRKEIANLRIHEKKYAGILQMRPVLIDSLSPLQGPSSPFYSLASQQQSLFQFFSEELATGLFQGNNSYCHGNVT